MRILLQLTCHISEHIIGHFFQYLDSQIEDNNQSHFHKANIKDQIQAIIVIFHALYYDKFIFMSEILDVSI